MSLWFVFVLYVVYHVGIRNPDGFSVFYHWHLGIIAFALLWVPGWKAEKCRSIWNSLPALIASTVVVGWMLWPTLHDLAESLSLHRQVGVAVYEDLYPLLIALPIVLLVCAIGHAIDCHARFRVVHQECGQPRG